jgi:flagellar assembly protein FliH
MDALIRAAQLAPFRRRLSSARAAVPEVSQLPQVSALRADIEKQVRAEMAAQSEDLYEAEHERARAEGLAAAIDTAADEIAKTRAQLREASEVALAALERAHDAVLNRIEASVGEVAFAAVCRFVGLKATSRDFVLGLAGQACAQLRAETQATARLHPRDFALLDELLEGGALRVHALSLNLVPDESLPLGGCVVEAASGHFDGGLENQLRRLHAALTGAG